MSVSLRKNVTFEDFIQLNNITKIASGDFKGYYTGNPDKIRPIGSFQLEEDIHDMSYYIVDKNNPNFAEELIPNADSERSLKKRYIKLLNQKKFEN